MGGTVDNFFTYWSASRFSENNDVNEHTYTIDQFDQGVKAVCVCFIHCFFLCCSARWQNFVMEL